MKKTFKNINNRISEAFYNAKCKLYDRFCSVTKTLSDTTGDLAANTIGGIIVAVVIIGLLIVAVNAFFPGFFTSMFEDMASKLGENW